MLRVWLNFHSPRRQDFTIHIDPANTNLISRVEELGLCFVTPIRTAAHIALSISGEKLCFEVVDRDVIGKGVSPKPRFIVDTQEDLAHDMQKLSHYYMYLKGPSNNLKASIDKVSVSFFEVQDTEPEPGHPRANAVKKNGARNLCENNVIDITVDDVMSTYGFELTNNNEDGEGLLPVLFYFDNIDFTISENNCSLSTLACLSDGLQI